MQFGRHLTLRFALLAGLFAVCAAPASAVPVTLRVFVGGIEIDSFDATELGCTASPTAICNGSVTPGDLFISYGLNLDAGANPNLGAGFGVENLSGGPLHITLLTELDVTVGPSSLTGGDAQFGFQDNGGDGATFSTVAGSAFYTALIDGFTHQMLYEHPISESVGSFGGANVLPTETFGPNQAGPAVTTRIGLRYDFQLTGDTDAMSVTGKFYVSPIPEPGTGLLLGFGLALAAVIRRDSRR
jgi:hypothetical protein